MNQPDTEKRLLWKSKLDRSLERALELLRLNGPDGNVAIEILLIFKRGVLLYPKHIALRSIGWMLGTVRREHGVCVKCDNDVKLSRCEQVLCDECDAKELADEFRGHVEFPDDDE